MGGKFSILNDGTVTFSGNSEIGSNGVAIGVGTVDVLVVGGGGGGGMDRDSGGGGGAGGLVFMPGKQVSGSVAVEVGEGGAAFVGSGTSFGVGGSGGNSGFGDLEALGGGGGGTRAGGVNGGSGGGAGAGARNETTSPGGSGMQSAQAGDSGEFGFGHGGGTSVNADPREYGRSGGGGGAGEAGGNAGGFGNNWAGDGGDGLHEVTIDGTTYNFAGMFGTEYGEIDGGQAWFAGGGGGGSRESATPGDGGKGGGGAGGQATGHEDGSGSGTAALANTGGGGGGAGTRGTGGSSGEGGSGIVMVRYAGDGQAANGGDSITSVGPYTLHRYTSTGGNPAFTPFTGFDASAQHAIIEGDLSGTGGLNVTGPGRLTLEGTNSYAGETTVSSGILVVDGTHAGGAAYTVADGAAIGGGGSIGSALTLDEGANFWWDGVSTLTVENGNAVSLDETFGMESLVGFNWDNIANDTYTLIANDTIFGNLNIQNWGSEEAYTLPDGRLAWFSEGSLQLNVVPEPSALGLLGMGLLTVYGLRRRRCA